MKSQCVSHLVGYYSYFQGHGFSWYHLQICQQLYNGRYLMVNRATSLAEDVAWDHDVWVLVLLVQWIWPAWPGVLRTACITCWIYAGFCSTPSVSTVNTRAAPLYPPSDTWSIENSVYYMLDFALPLLCLLWILAPHHRTHRPTPGVLKTACITCWIYAGFYFMPLVSTANTHVAPPYPTSDT